MKPKDGCAGQFRKTSFFESSYQARAWSVFTDRQGLQNALVNLVINARDAMPDGGKVTIETANYHIREPYELESGEYLMPGRYVLVAITDTGKGISKADQKRIFEPFYSSKPMHEGSGLGLSMVQGFMRQNGGTVSVYSEEGVGTSFKLYLPASNDDLVPEKAVLSQPAVPASDHGARVLVVEDQTEVLMVIVHQLTRAGYAVTTAMSGDKGLEVFQGKRAI